MAHYYEKFHILTILAELSPHF